MIYPCIVPVVGLHANGDRDHLARPGAGRTLAVIADELAHDVGILLINPAVLLVDIVEVETEIVRLQQGGHAVVQRWLHRPLLLLEATSLRHGAWSRPCVRG